jgi:hypothetical protein
MKHSKKTNFNLVIRGGSHEKHKQKISLVITDVDACRGHGVGMNAGQEPAGRTAETLFPLQGN